MKCTTLLNRLTRIEERLFPQARNGYCLEDLMADIYRNRAKVFTPRDETETETYWRRQTSRTPCPKIIDIFKEVEAARKNQ